MSKQINLIINGKGGVGKSFFATNFALTSIGAPSPLQMNAKENFAGYLASQPD